jgi:diguanylate cyclase (GGDEF)-like protein
LGDTLLRELGSFLKRQIRGGDIACRYGGDEFLLLLPEAPLEITRQRAEKLREGIQHIQVRHQGKLLEAVTLSLGVAAFPEHGQEIEEVVRAADAALYHAKQAGRNQVVSAKRSRKHSGR